MEVKDSYPVLLPRNIIQFSAACSVIPGSWTVGLGWLYLYVHALANFAPAPPMISLFSSAAISKCPKPQECQAVSENVRRARSKETHAASKIGLARSRPESLGLRTELFRVVNLIKFVQIVVAKKWIKRLQSFFEVFA